MLTHNHRVIWEFELYHQLENEYESIADQIKKQLLKLEYKKCP